MKKLLFLISFFFLISCNYVFIIKRDKVVREQKGYILFNKLEIDRSINDFFIPVSSIDTSKSILQNLFETDNQETGFRLNISIKDRHEFISSYCKKFYNDDYEKLHLLTLNDFHKSEFGNIYIMPATIVYAEILPKGKLEYKAIKTMNDTCYTIQDKKSCLSFSKGKKVWLLKIYPLLF